MFNNIIYFIIVLLLFNIHNPGHNPENVLGYDLLWLSAGWLIFASFCWFRFNRLRAFLEGDWDGEGRFSRGYQRLILQLSVLAVFLFALDIYFFDLKYWIQMIPGLKTFSVFQGIIAIALFFFYLSTIWYLAHPAHEGAFRTNITRRGFILSNVKFNMPVLFPWMALSFIYDIISLSRWPGLENFLNRPEGQIPFFASFLIVLMIFMPRFIQYWWACKPFDQSERLSQLNAFLQENGLKYRSILRWPIFEGRIMTAGIMGILPRYRYILITDALMEILSLEELKAVLAHEIAHAKYRHMFFFIIFFVGYMFLSFGLFDVFIYFITTRLFFMEILESSNALAKNLIYLVLALPVMFSILVYFRVVMGFFMRHFERQADLYSAMTMGSPKQTISALEKIALLSGRIRNLPSWHHFSIRQRVDCLWRFRKEPGLIKKHNRLILIALGIYFISVIGLGYLINFSPLKKNMTDHIFVRVLSEQLDKEPDNILLHQNLALLYHRMGKQGEAVKAYEAIIFLDPDHAPTLNNFAWLLATSQEKEIRDEKRALDLAKKAVAIKRSPMFLDTLAEAFYVNGFINKSVETIQEAISLADENRGYYKKQLEKFTGDMD